uniref:Amino acid transporter transmembrane domain-containing protein n=1 Tax=Oryza brachyantha TaxID=4533 RepID=J3LWV0_ORYBR
MEKSSVDATREKFSRRNVLHLRTLYLALCTFMAAVVPFFDDIVGVVGAVGFIPLDLLVQYIGLGFFLLGSAPSSAQKHKETNHVKRSQLEKRDAVAAVVQCSRRRSRSHHQQGRRTRGEKDATIGLVVPSSMVLPSYALLCGLAHVDDEVVGDHVADGEQRTQATENFELISIEVDFVTTIDANAHGDANKLATSH